MQLARQTCSRCIMDTSDPEIQFDSAGVCSHCKDYEIRVRDELAPVAEREARLQALVSKIKERGKNLPYDCIIGVSGGVDSTMVAYHVKRLGLRPLAVHLDNGWNSELAVDNIKKTIETLQIDLATHVIDWEEFRDLQLSFLKASVPNCEIPTDHAIYACLFQVAKQQGTRYIIVGSNVVTEALLPRAWGYVNLDLKHIKAIHRRFGTVPLKTFPHQNLPSFLFDVLVRGIRAIPLLNYVDFNKADAKQLIQRELGWRDYGGKHFESIYTRFFQGYILPTKFGYDKRRAHLSNLVLSGQITREQAIKEMDRSPYAGVDFAEDREFVIKKLGITEAEFEAILNAPPRLHRDYPSHHYFFLGMPKLKKAFKKLAMTG